MTDPTSEVSTDASCLESSIKDARQFGDVRVVIESHTQSSVPVSTKYLNNLLENHGLHEIGEFWRPLDRQSAINTIKKCIRCDTFGWIPAVPASVAEQLTYRFLKFFADDALFHSNFFVDEGLPIEPGRNGFCYRSATDWSSDIGVVAVDDSRAGFIWVMDED